MELIKIIATTIREYLNEAVFNDDDKINLQLSKFKERKDFVNKKFNLLNKGTGRNVYLIGDEYVLKIAKNNKGIAQNKTEIEISKSNKYNDIISNIIEYNDNGYYVIAQKANRITDEIFQELTGLQLQGFLYYLRFNKEWDGRNKPFYNKVNSLVKDFDLDRFDVSDISSWGVIGDKPVIVDYGLDGITARKLYGVNY